MFDGIWEPEDCVMSPRQQQEQRNPIVSNLGEVITEQFQGVDKMRNEDICYILDKILEDEFGEEMPNEEGAGIQNVGNDCEDNNPESQQLTPQDENMTLDELNGKIKRSLDVIVAYAAIEKRFRDPVIVKKQLKRFMVENEIKENFEKVKILWKKRWNEAECEDIKTPEKAAPGENDERDSYKIIKKKDNLKREKRIKVLKFIKEPPATCDFEKVSSVQIVFLNEDDTESEDNVLTCWMKKLFVGSNFSKAISLALRNEAKANDKNKAKKNRKTKPSTMTVYTSMPMDKSKAKASIQTPDKENDKSITTATDANIPTCGRAFTTKSTSRKPKSKGCNTNETVLTDITKPKARCQIPATGRDRAMATAISMAMSPPKPSHNDMLTTPIRTMVWHQTTAYTRKHFGNPMSKVSGRIAPVFMTDNPKKKAPVITTPIYGSKVTRRMATTMSTIAPSGITTGKPNLLRGNSKKKDFNITTATLTNKNMYSVKSKILPTISFLTLGLSKTNAKSSNEDICSMCSNTHTSMPKVTERKFHLATTAGTTKTAGATKAIHNTPNKKSIKAEGFITGKGTTLAEGGIKGKGITIAKGAINGKGTTTDKGITITMVKGHTAAKQKTVTMRKLKITNATTCITQAKNTPFTQTKETLSREILQKEVNNAVLKKSLVSHYMNYPPSEDKPTVIQRNKPTLIATFLPIEDNDFEANPPAKR